MPRMHYTLMHRNHEVLEFDIDFATERATNVQPREGAAWAPLGVLVP